MNIYIFLTSYYLVNKTRLNYTIVSPFGFSKRSKSDIENPKGENIVNNSFKGHLN